MERDPLNPAIGHGTGRYGEYYEVYDILIHTNLILFDKICFKEEVHKGIQESSNVEELKDILYGLMKLAKENIELFDKVYSVKYTEGNPNEFYECLPVEFRKCYYNIDDDKQIWTTREDAFLENKFEYAYRYYQRTEDMLFFCGAFYNFIEGILKGWIETKELDRALKSQQLTSYKREWKKFYLGAVMGFIFAVAAALINSYFSYRISH